MAKANMVAPYELYIVAGGFPPGLNTSFAQDVIKPDETPDSYGLNIALDGRLGKGTAPTGTSRIEKSITISSIPYYWHYHRLWNITNKTAATASNILTYGAKNYNDIYVPQRNGQIYFDEDSQTIVAIAPIFPDSLFVAKSTGSYILSNLLGQWGNFQKSDIIQEMLLAVAARMIVVNNVVYVSNSTGLWAYKQGQVVEITRNIRNSLYGLIDMTLTADYQKNWIIGTSGTTTMVYDANTNKLFKWVASTFRYTTKQFHSPDYSPIGVSRLMFVIEHGTTTDGSIKYQVRYEDEAWPVESKSIIVKATEEKFTTITEDLERSRSSVRFQLCITDISSNKYIKQISVDSDAFRFDAYKT
jgi:hypothetical protein